jgi:hypothetical protein
MIKKQTTVPITSFMLLDPIQANKPKTAITIGQGELTSNFSSQTKKYNKGSKKFSIPSPYSLEKLLKLESTAFLNALKAFASITGILVKNSIILLFY